MRLDSKEHVILVVEYHWLEPTDQECVYLLGKWPDLDLLKALDQDTSFSTAPPITLTASQLVELFPGTLIETAPTALLDMILSPPHDGSVRTTAPALLLAEAFREKAWFVYWRVLHFYPDSPVPCRHQLLLATMGSPWFLEFSLAHPGRFRFEGEEWSKAVAYLVRSGRPEWVRHLIVNGASIPNELRITSQVTDEILACLTYIHNKQQQ